jgi:hypothetical protein
VTVTFDPAAGPIGTYGGRLVATSGDTVVQTTVGGHKEPEHYDLTVRMIDRDGREIPAGDQAGVSLVRSLDDQELAFFPVLGNEPVRVPPGRYAVMGSAETPVAGQPIPSVTAVAAPEVTVERDTSVTLDARKANKVGVRVDKKEAKVAAGVTGLRVDTGSVVGGYTISSQFEDLYALPTSGNDHFLHYDRAQVEQPLVRLTVDAPEAFEVPVAWVPSSPEPSGVQALTSVDVGHATPEEIAAHDLTGTLAVFTLGAGEEEEFNARMKAIADAGAAALLFRFSENISIGVDQVPIPAVYTMRPEGARLAALGTASVTRTAIVASPYRYELAFPHPGGVPAEVDYRVRDRQLASVRAKYGAMVTGGVGYLDFGTEAYGQRLDSSLWSTVLPLPVERTEYYTPGPVRWTMSVRTAPSRDGGVEHGVYGPWVTYRPGSRQTARWHQAVFGPSLAVDRLRYTGQPYLVAREGDTIRAELPLLSDAGRHSGYPAPEDYSFADTGETSLYAGGSLVGSSGLPGAGEFTVPPGAGDYRLVSSVTRNNPLWPLSTQVSAEWTFRSAHTDTATPLPLLAVGFTAPVDLLNYAPAGRRVTIPVTVDRQTGAEGGRPGLDRVEYSVDDGATWVRVTPRTKGGHWEVSVPNPASGFVSLRASASDRDGNSVKQTILRAYRVS